jgi:hypothetical protein
MLGAKPLKVEKVTVKRQEGDNSYVHEGEHTIYLWKVPWEEEK